MKNVQHHHDADRRRHFTSRAQYVIHAYLADHPEKFLNEKVSSGVVSLPEAYHLLKEFARDPKTGVQRSDLLGYAISFEMENTRKSQQPFTVVVFDIDDFKRINEELGHVAADDVLKRVAEIMNHTIRKSDDVIETTHGESVVRWGGEEFVVILSGVDLKNALRVADRIRERIRTELSGLRPTELPITVSGGLAQFDPEKDKEWKQLLERADKELYAAKKAGKDVVFPKKENESL